MIEYIIKTVNWYMLQSLKQLWIAVMHWFGTDSEVKSHKKTFQTMFPTCAILRDTCYYFFY